MSRLRQASNQVKVFTIKLAKPNESETPLDKRPRRMRTRAVNRFMN